MPEVTRAREVMDAFERGGLREVFVEELGWEQPQDYEENRVLSFDSVDYNVNVIAALKGFRIYSVASPERISRHAMRQIDRALGELAPERFEIFKAPDVWTWHWPRRSTAGTVTFETVDTMPGKLPWFLAQRLTGLEFSIRELRKGVTLVDVRDRVQGNFDVSAVTKKFYEQFAKEQAELADSIGGLPDGRELEYSTTLLNRLMFLYFLQKKELLNGDSNYLENTLQAVRNSRGDDKFYNFYRDALLPLFFDKLNSRNGEIKDPSIRKIIGKVPYINGGIFGQTDIEEDNFDSLTVPDAAFEKIFDFFSSFSWHLDTRPTQSSDEINPEVIGYIFEQFINVAASGKKENGAYYTPHDVTAYMVAQTLVPRILDDLDELNDVFNAISSDIMRYVQPLMLHGYDFSSDRWLEVPEEVDEAWSSGPENWADLDHRPADDSLLLPGETWVEMMHRRERVCEIQKLAEAGQIRNVNDIVTYNLNGQLALTDAIDRITDPERAVRLFEKLSELSVFDPTCGSGAFLFAALEVLEDIYAHVVDAAIAAGASDRLGDYTEQSARANGKRYFIRKHVAIRNLYGTDLMPGAIETAKLRIFLALAACIDSSEDFKPLPDLDFNLKAGNLIVGLKDADDIDRIGSDFFARAFLVDLQEKISEHTDLYSQFRDAIANDSDEASSLKDRLRKNEEKLRPECDHIYAQVAGIPDSEFEDWVESARPFHWFCEFPEIIKKGGFDVVIGNPPYVKRREVSGYSVAGYETSTCADLYAPCYERSLSLTHPSGRHAFIVMSSLAVWDAFAPLREVISSRGGSEWWSTYGKIPAALFKGVKVRNTIVVLGPGDEKFVTRHHIFTARQREWLFPTIEYSRSARVGAEWPVRGGVATPVLERLRDLELTAGPDSGANIYLRPTATYWFPAMLGPAPVLNSDGNVIEPVDTRLRVIPLGNRESRADAIAMLGSRLTYLWWTAIGDDFDVYQRETIAPRALALVARDDASWDAAVSSVINAARDVVYVSLNKKWYFNVRWNNIRHVTDELDQIALRSMGVSADDWRALNVLYRQVMRSSGDSAKGRYVSPEEMSSMLGW